MRPIWIYGGLIYMFKYMSDKDKILKGLNYNESGYQSISNVYKEATEEDNTITLKYVKGWYTHFNEPKTHLKGTNSYMAPYPECEYQLDIFFFRTNQHQT